MKFKTACQNYQAEESAVKCLSQKHNKMDRLVLNLDRNIDRNHGALNH